MQAIRTRYYGPTNTRGSRIVAKCEGGSVTVPFNYSLDHEGNHRKAAELLLTRLGWQAVYNGGQFADDYYWVASDPWRGLVAAADTQAEAA